MKKQLTATALSFLIAACTHVSDNTPDEALFNTKPILPVQADTKNDVAIATNPASSKATLLKETAPTITLEQIMSDPDWFARSPESWYWGVDSKHIFYQQKQLGNPIRDLYTVGLLDNTTTRVSLSELHGAADKNGVLNAERTHKVYIFNGDVFVKALANNEVKQLTFTSKQEKMPLFLLNGDIAYQIDSAFYRHSLTTGQVKELANIVMADDPEASISGESYLAKEQHKLIEYIALQQRNSDLKDARKQRLATENNFVNNVTYFFGKENQLVHASLSPAGDRILVSITDKKSPRDKTDIMPNYITKDGTIAAEEVRARVANNRQYNEELYVINLVDGSQTKLAYENLPDFDKDVLAKVKSENFAREGKRYYSQTSTRNIHVLNMDTPIQWSDNGQNLAIMLEAWDNKTRWLTTVDFDKNILVTQHKLEDEAWINWSFNEFGWLSVNNNDGLYYLSEESGYSHLYYKGLTDKPIQLTSGKFEVSDVTLSLNKQSFFFKANKKHPGIYEVYQVGLNKNLVALTNLGGQNNYSVSPDESKLLIEHSTVTMPPELYVIDLADTENNAIEMQQAQKITDTVTPEFLAMPWSSPTVVAIPSSKQREPIYSKVYLPKDYDVTAEKNRAVMFSHGAGYLQNSHMGWSGYFREYMFHSMLVQQGYVVIDMDYRASAGYGRDWRTAIYRHMGKPEVEDMRDGVEWLVANANVDEKRVGTYGGSYGGFLTLMSMFTDPDLFASGSALRLVSDWAYYNHGYTSNILNTPEDDAIAYERSSPIYFAEGLSKPLLINAPMVDDNVFFEDTVRLVQRLIELEKQDFETAIYPVEPHGFVQPSSWLNEYRRIYKLFENTL